jgi:DNA-binding transcriptional LysR family regulator
MYSQSLRIHNRKKEDETTLVIKQLEYFISIYENKSFTAAARKLNISQQGLSKSIKNLENELGIPLFLRNHNQLQPTASGQLLYTQAVHLTEEWAKTLKLLENAKKENIPFKIGLAASVFGALHIETAIWNFRQKHQELSIQISNETDYDCERKIEDGNLDIAFSMGPFLSKDIQSHLLAEESIYALLPCSHPLAEKERLYICDILEEPLITSDEKNKGYSCLLSDFQGKNAVPHIAFGSSDPQTHLQLVHKGLGISLFPEHWLSLIGAFENLRAIPIADIQKRRIYIIHKKASPKKALLRQFIKLFL